MEIQETIDALTAAMPDATPLPQPAPSKRGRKFLHFAAGFLFWTGAGLFLWLCYFPVACGWLGWVALVPLLFLVRSSARPRSVYFSAWIAGSAFFWTALSWMRVADDRMYATWAMLAVYCSFYFPVAIWFMRFLDRRTRLPLMLTVPVVWTALEFLRAHLMTGFAWYFLAHTQHDFLPAIQIADLGGAYAVTFVVAAVNAMLFEWLYRLSRSRDRQGAEGLNLPALPNGRGSFYLLTRGKWKLALQSVAVIALMIGTLSYGVWRLGQDGFAYGPYIALIQSNLDQRLRNAAAPGNYAAERMVMHNRALSDRAARMLPDLIVWPETSYPEDWTEISPDLPADRIPLEWRRQHAESKDLARLVASRWKTDVLFGMNAEELGANGKRSRYNSAVLIQKDGRCGGRYDKMHRVPFGEFVPLRESLPWMNRFSPYDFDYSIRPGEEFTRFSLKDHRFGVLICYEDSDPTLARQYVRPGDEPPADFLINISNDGWFNGSAEHEEHLAISRFRAVECRRALARAVNMGISVVIDGNGRVLWPWCIFRTWPNGEEECDDEGAACVPLTVQQGTPFIPGLYFDRHRHRQHPSYHREFLAEHIPFVARLFPAGEEGVYDLEVYGRGFPVPFIPLREWAEFKQVGGILYYPVPLDTRESLYARYGDWLPWSCWAILGMGLVCGVVRPKS